MGAAAPNRIGATAHARASAISRRLLTVRMLAYRWNPGDERLTSEVVMRIRCAVAILLLECSAAPAQPVARTLTPADTVAPREIGEVAIAPDSSAIAFIVSQANLIANRT